MKIVNFTHGDLDGVLSSLFLKQSLKDSSELVIQSNGYGSIEKNILKLDSDLQSCDYIVVTDLNLTQGQYDMLSIYNKPVIILDHHETANLQVNTNTKYFYDTSIAACKIVYEKFKSRTPRIICDLGDTYDMWRRDSELWDDAYKLNELFWYYGFDNFITIYENQKVVFTQQQRDILKSIKKEKDEYLKDVKDNYSEVLGDVFFVYHPKFKHISDISLKFDSHKYYLIMKGVTDFSVKTNNPNFDFEVFMKKCEGKVDFVNIGGHTLVGGFVLREETISSDLEKIVGVLNDYK